MTSRFHLTANEFLLDGHPFVIRCGELHYTRVPREEWTHRLQMCRAMGLNTVCVYGFWNFHEWQEGRFDWSGQADVAEFCRLAQAEGLWVLLRPGPYSCAEWEMGGLPWWLLKRQNIRLRTTDPAFLEPATRYLREVGRVLAPLQITHGGPILMVQVENEYGSFGDDAEYMGAIRQALLDGGFDVPLFACNPPSDIAKGLRPDLFQVVNFGPGGAQAAFETLRGFQPSGPLMNGEYYPAWFDTWGTPHHKGEAEPYLRDLEWMLQRNISFSIYMAHGGTSFGLWSGADRPFRPDTSSYDYDAPISEAGWTTDKFHQTRDLFARYLLPGETLPEPPAPHPVISIDRFELHEAAPLLDNLPQPIADETPRLMEAYDQSRGCILYRTTLLPGQQAVLSVGAVHDFGWVLLDGQPIGQINRRAKKYCLALPERQASARLDILIEAMGRVNFGPGLFDPKGLHAPARLTSDAGAIELRNWQIFPMPLDEPHLAALKFETVENKPAPAFWRGSFELEAVGDTFLDVRAWGKGVLWVNGRCLGRFWNIGPTQTMYCPGAWLRAGRNEVIVLDLIGPQSPVLVGLTQPILDGLRPELNFARPERAAGEFNLNGDRPAASGRFEAAVRWQEARFAQPLAGRYLCLEALSAHDGGLGVAVAELDALDAKGCPLPKTHWSVLSATSEEIVAEDGLAENAIDGQAASFWRTRHDEHQKADPHRLIVDLGGIECVSAIRYLPRAGGENVSGRIAEFRVYLSENPFGLKSA